MELKDYLTAKNIQMSEFGRRIGRSEAVISRLCAKKQFPGSATVLKIVKETRGHVGADDLLRIPAKWRCVTCK